MFPVRKGDIIFNHRQTEEILQNGSVTANGGRGAPVGFKANANGTANATGNAYLNGTYVSGGGKFYGGASKYNSYNAAASNYSTGAGQVYSSASNSASSATEAADEFKETMDWVEIKIDRLERKIDQLDTVAQSVFTSWEKRSESLADEFSKVTEEIALQQSAYETYVNKANSLGLDAGYAEKVKNGELSIEDITDEDLHEKIQDYQEWYEKALDCLDAQVELKETLQEIVQTDFDNLIKQYEQLADAIEHNTNLYDNTLDIIENQGNFAGAEYYKNLMESTTEQMNTIQEEIIKAQDTLNKAVWSGKVTEGTEQYNDNIASINDLKEQWQELYNQNLEYRNDMWQMDWDSFDKALEYVGKLTEETEFLMDLMSTNENDLFNKKNGELNDWGKTTGALHAVNYDVYMAEADKYAAKVKEINAMIANDPTNTILIDQRNEYVKAQQESIQAAQEEKKAVQELISDSYDKMLDVLEDMIDKRKEQLEAEKDLYDYQGEIADQTKEITDLQKQLMAIEGDDSEEARSKRQSLTDELKDAQKELQDTEYDKWLDDQETMLDNLYDEYETILNERLDHIDALMQSMIDYANKNAENIQNTIKNVATAMGYTISTGLEGAISSDQKDGMTNFYGDGKNNTSANKYVENTVDKINGSINESGTVIKPNDTTYTKEQWEAEQPKPAPTPAPTTNTRTLDDATVMGIASAIWCEGNSGWGNDPFRSGRLVEKFGQEGRDRVQGYINAHAWNGDLYRYWANNLGYNASNFHYSAFDTGGYTGNDEGFAMLHTKERVLNAQQTSAFEEFIYKQLPELSDLLGSFDSSGLSTGGEYNKTVNADVNVSISLPNVQNASDFIDGLKSNKNFEKLVRSMTIDQLAGKNSLAKNRIKF